jgi:cell division protein YceG involved in septum cleavage
MPNYYSSRLKHEKSRSRNRKIFLTIIAILIIGGAITGYLGYWMVYKPNVWLNGQSSTAFNIKSGSTWDDVKQMLYKNGTIIHRESFERLASIMKYPDHIKSGHYILKEGMRIRSNWFSTTFV